ncbi:c5.4 [Tranosema rostrale ichnovirus]|nr:c5.4 [Tranosema rostrale ichnovirus]
MVQLQYGVVHSLSFSTTSTVVRLFAFGVDIATNRFFIRAVSSKNLADSISSDTVLLFRVSAVLSTKTTSLMQSNELYLMMRKTCSKLGILEHGRITILIYLR